MILLYNDDIEICNPLGSHRSVHKMSKWCLWTKTTLHTCTCSTSAIHYCHGVHELNAFFFVLTQHSSNLVPVWTGYALFPSCQKALLTLCLFVASGMFYYLLANISPQYRSQIKAIQLVCVAPSSAVTNHGVDAILEPFVEDVKKLEKVCVIDILHNYFHAH